MSDIQSKTKKCRTCKAIIPDLGDISKGELCDKCADNKERQQFFENTAKVEKAAVEKKTPLVLEHINKIENPELVGKLVTIEGVVSSTSVPYVVPSEFRATLHEADQDLQRIAPKIEIYDPINASLVAINQETKDSRLNKYFKIRYPDCIVKDRGEIAHRTVYVLRLRPEVFSLERSGEKIVDEKGYEYKHLDVFVVSEKNLTFSASTMVRLSGSPIANPKTQKTTLLAYAVSFPEDDLSFDKEKMNAIRKVFEGKNVAERIKWILFNFELYSHIVGRQNIAELGLLSYFSPLMIDFNGECQRGWAITAVIGDTTTGKSETIKKLSKLLRAGSVVSAETASTVGLTGTTFQMENGTWLIDWGFLPLMDRKLLAIDGSHKLSASCWAALAEAERSGVLSIAKAAKSSTNARTRQIRIYNAVDREVDRYTTKSLSSFLHPCQATPTVLDKTSISRLDLCIYSDQRDVSPLSINQQFTQEPDPALKELAEVLKWAWGNTASVEWTQQAISELLEQSTKLYEKFFYESIPLVSIDVKWKIARLSVALAYCTLSANAEYSVVQVKVEHVRVIVDFLIQEYNKSGLGVLAKENKIERLNLEDVACIIQRVRQQLIKKPIENLPEILAFLVTENHATYEQIKLKFNLSDNNQARPLMAILKSEGLISVKTGYYPTPKLIEAHKLTEGFTVLSDLSESSMLKKEPSPKIIENSKENAVKLTLTSSETDKPDNPDKIETDNHLNDYTQRNYRVKIKKFSNARKCSSCDSLTEEWQYETFINDKPESTAFCCSCCLRDKIIPAYKAQGAIINLEVPTPTEEVS